MTGSLGKSKQNTTKHSINLEETKKQLESQLSKVEQELDAWQQSRPEQSLGSGYAPKQYFKFDSNEKHGDKLAVSAPPGQLVEGPTGRESSSSNATGQFQGTPDVEGTPNGVQERLRKIREELGISSFTEPVGDGAGSGEHAGGGSSTQYRSNTSGVDQMKKNQFQKGTKFPSFSYHGGPNQTQDLNWSHFSHPNEPSLGTSDGKRPDMLHLSDLSQNTAAPLRKTQHQTYMDHSQGLEASSNLFHLSQTNPSAIATRNFLPGSKERTSTSPLKSKHGSEGSTLAKGSLRPQNIEPQLDESTVKHNQMVEEELYKLDRHYQQRLQLEKREYEKILDLKKEAIKEDVERSFTDQISNYESKISQLEQERARLHQIQMENIQLEKQEFQAKKDMLKFEDKAKADKEALETHVKDLEGLVDLMMKEQELNRHNHELVEKISSNNPTLAGQITSQRYIDESLKQKSETTMELDTMKQQIQVLQAKLLEVNDKQKKGSKKLKKAPSMKSGRSKSGRRSQSRSEVGLKEQFKTFGEDQTRILQKSQKYANISNVNKKATVKVDEQGEGKVKGKKGVKVQRKECKHGRKQRGRSRSPICQRYQKPSQGHVSTERLRQIRNLQEIYSNPQIRVEVERVKPKPRVKKSRKNKTPPARMQKGKADPIYLAASDIPTRKPRSASPIGRALKDQPKPKTPKSSKIKITAVKNKKSTLKDARQARNLDFKTETSLHGQIGILLQEKSEMEEKLISQSREIAFLKGQLHDMAMSQKAKDIYTPVIPQDGHLISKRVEREVEVFRDIYEQRCRTLTDISNHWKSKTRLLVERYYDQLAVLKEDNLRLKMDVERAHQGFHAQLDGTLQDVAQSALQMQAGYEGEIIRLRGETKKLKKKVFGLRNQQAKGGRPGLKHSQSSKLHKSFR